jgi:hypothetical protein
MPAYGGMWTLSQVAQAIKNTDWTGIPPTVVEYLIVAGGGGGGYNQGGGGGGGGLLQGYAGITLGSSYYVTVGSGGSSANSGTPLGGSGGNSVFDATGSGATTGRIVATGGGGGYGAAGAGGNGVSGGSGGGAGGGGSSTYYGGGGSPGQGNAGGAANTSGTYTAGGAGGGGAGTVGLSASGTGNAGNGGSGIASDITGTRVVYSGGGGGGTTSATAGTGGAGGGGAGFSGSGTATSGTVNTGGGGGGVWITNSGAGGSGIVVIRYPGNVQYFTGGTLNYSNGFMVHTFYSSGTLTPTTPRLFASPDYQISRSIRFNNPDGPLLERAGGAGGNRQTWTWSGWVKRSKLNTGNNNVPFVFGASDRAAGSAYLQFGRYGSDSDIDCLNFNEQSGGAYNITTEAKFRDMSAWYHIVCAYNTTQSVASDRVKIYVNGVLQTITSGSTYPPQNLNGWLNYPTFPDLIGAYTTTDFNLTLNGYMAEINFVDGQQLTPASFGYTESSTGVWTPLQYTGSYGTRGYYVNFADNSNTTAATLGKDLSGNANNFTPTNFSVTAGVGNDSLLDSPTNYGVDTGLGGEVRGNYCTLNPLIKPVGTVAYSNGNLVATNSTANWNAIGGTIGISSGKWYWEYISGGQNTFFGIMVPTINFSSGNPQDANAAAGSVLLCDDNKYQIDYNTRVTYTATGHASGAVVGVAVDMDAGTIIFYINGVSQGTITWTSSAAYGKTVIPMAVAYDSGYVTTANFGQRPFAYTAPSGYRALCTQNLPESAAGRLPGNYFGVATYTGNGSTNSVGPFSFQPDLAWTKSRSGIGGHNILRDSVRGSTKRLISNGAFAELDDATYGTFTYNGLGLGSNLNHNASGTTYVAWAWNTGGTTVTNTTGSISAQVRANPAAGFSIVTYTGLTPWPQTIGHGLGVAPNMIIIKNRSRAATSWAVYHSSLGNTKGLLLDSTSSPVTDSGFWNNTTPTSSLFTTGNGYGYFVNAATDNYVAYCFAEIAGYSKFSSYVGNGSADGPFVYTGFRPAFILTKDITTDSFWWEMVDSARSSYNPSNKTLYANAYDAEYTSSGYDKDLLSNGFKIRGTNDGQNTSGSTYIYAAFAESPFKYARAR